MRGLESQGMICAASLTEEDSPAIATFSEDVKIGSTEMILIDSHCHIDGEQFEADRDGVVQRAKEAGVAGDVECRDG